MAQARKRASGGLPASPGLGIGASSPGSALRCSLLERSWHSGGPLTADACEFRLASSRGARKRLGGESLGIFTASSQRAAAQAGQRVALGVRGMALLGG
jgi:hypothetical protein